MSKISLICNSVTVELPIYIINETYLKLFWKFQVYTSTHSKTAEDQKSTPICTFWCYTPDILILLETCYSMDYKILILFWNPGILIIQHLKHKKRPLYINDFNIVPVNSTLARLSQCFWTEHTNIVMIFIFYDYLCYCFMSTWCNIDTNAIHFILHRYWWCFLIIFETIKWCYTPDIHLNVHWSRQM